MTVNTQNRTAGPYAGNGTTATFPFTFKVFQPSELVVAITNADGSQTDLVYSSDFTVSLNPDQNSNPGGNITLLAGNLAVGRQLDITSDLAILQPAELTNQGGFFPKVIEGALDRLTILIQQLFSVTFRKALRVPEIGGTTDIPDVSVRAGKILAFDSSGRPITVAPADQTATSVALQLDAYKTEIAAPGGSALVGFIQAGAGAVLRTVLAKLLDLEANGRDFGVLQDGATDDTIKLQGALASGKPIITLDGPTVVSTTITLQPNQELRFVGRGALVPSAGFAGANGVLYASGIAGVRITKPRIDASATAGIVGINLLNCVDPVVDTPKLTKCNLNLAASSNATKLNYQIQRPRVDLAGWAVTAVYISAVNGCTVTDPVLNGGKEGIGIYNAVRALKVRGGRAYNFTQDGFVIIDGQEIDVSGMSSHENGQSGFTTQRQTAASNCRKVTFRGCKAYQNAFDGFDIRGGNSAPWSDPLDVTLSACMAYQNSGNGIYLVNANGSKALGCEARQNAQQGIFVDASDNAVLVGNTASSNCSGVPSAGPNKSGILVYNSADVVVDGCRSINDEGATQEYGVGFSGSCPRYNVVGGNYQNNMLAPIYESGTGTITGPQADTLAGAGVFYHATLASGARIESGFLPPTHVAAPGSMYLRNAGATGEIYISNGGGSWTIR